MEGRDGTWDLRVHAGEGGKFVLGGILLEFALELLELLDGFLPGACDVGLLPRAGPSRAGMLDEQMAGAHLVGLLGSTGSVGRVKILRARERADRLVCMTLWNLPCRLLRHTVVEVRQSTRVAEANLPLRLSYTVLSVYTRDSSWI